MEQRVYERVRKQVILCQDGSPFVPQYPGGINFFKCTGCEECIKVCPQRCIELHRIDGKLVAVLANLDLCIGDGMCKIVCPEDAFL
jgi:NAD-dependent dihydropyrimidine dehydrogenase PreA subunit